MKEITLKHGVALMDDEDYERLKTWKWWSEIHHKGIPSQSIRAIGHDTLVPYKKGPLKKMHRIILGVLDPDIKVDHVNHNTLDNRKDNLRLCTQEENNRNRRKITPGSSSFKGVHLDRGRWRAQISVEGKAIHLGGYVTEKEAADAYALAVKTYHGNFACTKTNFVIDTQITNAIE